MTGNKGRKTIDESQVGGLFLEVCFIIRRKVSIDEI